MSFAITPLQDAVHLAGLHESAFSPAIGAAWDAPAFAALLRQDSVRAFGTAAGFILLQSVAEEAEILTLAVHPKARRSGLARALIEQAQDTLSVARIFLEVAEDNARARALCGLRVYRDGAKVGLLQTPRWLARRCASLAASSGGKSAKINEA